jgi:hypothetical protein
MLTHRQMLEKYDQVHQVSEENRNSSSPESALHLWDDLNVQQPSLPFYPKRCEKLFLTTPVRATSDRHDSFECEIL